MNPFSSFSEASSAVQRKSFLFSAAFATVTIQVLALLLDGPDGLLYSVPTTAIAVIAGHRLLGQPLTRRAGSDAKPIAERPAVAWGFVLVGLGGLPAVWALAGWLGVGALVLLVVGMALVLRAPRRRG